MIELGIGDGLRRRKFRISRTVFSSISYLLGARWVDTAQQYGSGEGEKTVATHATKFEVSTKIGLWQQEKAEDTERWNQLYYSQRFGELARKSLERLGRTDISVLMLHCSSADVDHDQQITVLESLKSQGLVNHIGFSADDVTQVPLRLQSFDCAEMPFSLARATSLDNFRLVLLNGISREKVKFRDLRKLVSEHKGVKFVILCGSSRLHRLVMSAFKVYALNLCLRRG